MSVAPKIVNSIQQHTIRCHVNSSLYLLY